MELVEAVATAGSSAASRELSEATASDRPSQREAQGRARREGPRQPAEADVPDMLVGFRRESVEERTTDPRWLGHTAAQGHDSCLV